MEIILGKTSGFCAGVKNAVEGAMNTNLPIVYAVGELVHNEQVLKHLDERGIKIIEDIKEVPDGANAIIRAHGVPKEVYDDALLRKINIIDYTCPNVLRIHKIIEEKSKLGYFIILLGDKNHPENIGSISYASEYYILENPDEISNALDLYKKSKCNKLLLISQTTYSVEKFNTIKDILLEEYPDIEIVNTICMATSKRQEETSKISREVDTMIIIGGKKSSNTKKLYEVAAQNCNNSIIISDVSELDKSKVYGKVGIMAGASTPYENVEEVINLLK